MTIGSINGSTNAAAGTSAISLNQGMDDYSKGLQKQIADAQKQLQELGKNEDLDSETKMKKRQEIQKQISDLNTQLRQHQMEERQKSREERQQKNQSTQAEENMTGLSQNSMRAIISAEGSLKQAKIQSGTANQMQNTADIKRAEIKRDGGGAKRSSDDSASISKKWDDVEGLEQKAQSALISQAASLAEADDAMKKAANAEKTEVAARTESEDDKAAAETEAASERISVGEGTEMTVMQAGEDTKTADVRSAGLGSNVDVKV